jgi:flagellar biosynthesis/type III secretory pathway M-ring protein FliF/YscJ
MPLFDWPASTASHVVTAPNFWIYWAVTIPLTLLVLTIWTAWIKVVVPRQERQDEEALESWEVKVNTDERMEDELKYEA